MKRIRKIDPVSVGKVSGFLYAMIGLVLGGLVSIIFLFTSSPDIPRFLGLGAIILLPLFYGGMGFVFGMFTAFLYNLATKYTGGILVEIEEDTPVPVPQRSSLE